MATRPLICRLTSPELQKRRTTVIRELKDLLVQREMLPDGLRLTFPGKDEMLDKLIEFIKSERLCCDFLSFRLSITDDSATLELSGPQGTGKFLEHEIGF